MSTNAPTSLVTARAPTVIISGAIVVDLLGQYARDFEKWEWNTTPQCVAFDAMQSLTYLKESCGGCAANIAYNLAALGANSLLVSAVGADFQPSYRTNLERVGVDLDGVRVFSGDCLTPRSVTLTDSSGRQFSFWASNGMRPQDYPSLEEFCDQGPADLIIVASNQPAIMLADLSAAVNCKVPCLWAPGGDVAGLGRAEMETAWANSIYIVINEPEFDFVRTTHEAATSSWSPNLRAVVITKGADGCAILQNGHPTILMDAASAESIVDPTGCGDAFTAGFAYGLTRGFSLQQSAHIGSVVAAFNLESQGTQSHTITLAQVEGRIRSG